MAVGKIELPIRNLLKKRFRQAFLGRKYFLEISKCIKCNKTAFIVFPEHDKELNFYGLLYLDDFATDSEYDSLVVITSDCLVAKTASLFSKKIEVVHEISEENMNNLISYYEFYNFSDDFSVLAIEKPEGRRGNNIIGKKSLSKEQFVKIGIYKLFIKENNLHSVSYDGNDADVKSFVHGEWSKNENYKAS